jgi:hypothetical protein
VVDDVKRHVIGAASELSVPLLQRGDRHRSDETDSVVTPADEGARRIHDVSDDPCTVVRCGEGLRFAERSLRALQQRQAGDEAGSWVT